MWIASGPSLSVYYVSCSSEKTAGGRHEVQCLMGCAGQKCHLFLPVLAATLTLGVLRAGRADSGHLMP